MLELLTFGIFLLALLLIIGQSLVGGCSFSVYIIVLIEIIVNICLKFDTEINFQCYYSRGWGK